MNSSQDPNNINNFSSQNNSESFLVNSSQGINTNQQYNTNDANEYSFNLFSKKSKVLMIFTLIGALILFFDKFITSMDWYLNLRISTIFTHDEELKQSLEMLDNLIEIFNWTIVVIITIVSILFLIKDKKQKKNISIYEWYIFAGLLHIFLGTVGITSILYSVSTLIISIKNKNAFKNESGKKVSKFYIVFSLIITSIILVGFIGATTGLFDEIGNKVDEVKEKIESKDKVVEDNDNNHTVTTFENFIIDWGNDITRNKSYKIQNVKLNNITASLYIDYTYEILDEIPISTITFKHGNDEIYKYTDKTDTFNVSYLVIYDNFIIYGARSCDNVNNGVCEKHLTYSQVLAFNKDEFLPFYDKTVISQGDGFKFYNDTSIFLEDENIYAEPYNDFRVYDIEIKNNYIYFDTIAEKYDVNFARDSLTYENNCNNPYWVSNTFDMQRTFTTKFVYNESYKTHEISSLRKVSSIKYFDYCNNKDVITFK